MEDDDYQENSPSREWWNYDVDRGVVAESIARVRAIPSAMRRGLIADLEAALAEFARAIKYSRGPLVAAGRTSIQWHPNDKDIHHTGRAYTDVDILSSPEFQSSKFFKSLRPKLHKSHSRAISIAASLLVIRDAQNNDGFSVELAANLIALVRPLEQRALARAQNQVEKIGLAGRNKRTRKSKKTQEAVRRVFLSFPKNDSNKTKMRALKARFPQGPKSSFLYACTADLRGAKRRRRKKAKND